MSAATDGGNENKNKSQSRFDQPLQSGMKEGESASASLHSLSDEFGFTVGQDAASAPFPHVEMKRRVKVTVRVTGCLPTSEGSANCRSLSESLTLLPEERTLIKTQEEMDGFCPQKLKKNFLPSISKGAEFSFERATRKKAPLSDCPKPLKPPPSQTAPCVKKSKRNANQDITPWVGNSLLDTSFGAIPQSLEPFPHPAGPPHHLLCGAVQPRYGISLDPMAEGGNHHGGAGSKTARQCPRAVSEGPAETKAFPAQGSGKDGWCRRRLRDKLRGGIRLPPVPSISTLSFSRNFTFSFFELSQHQSQQHRAHGTHAAYLLMKQFQY